MTVGLGECIYVSLKPVFKIYLIIGTGFILVKTDNLSIETAKGISNLIVNALLPCLAFNKIVGNISDKDIKTIGVIILVTAILYLFGLFGALVTNYTTPVPKKWFYGLLFSGIFPNISDFPIAYLQSMETTGLFPTVQVDKGVAYACIFMGIQNFLLMNLGLFKMVGYDIDDSDSSLSSSSSLDRNELNDTEIQEDQLSIGKSESNSDDKNNNNNDNDTTTITDDENHSLGVPYLTITGTDSNTKTATSASNDGDKKKIDNVYHNEGEHETDEEIEMRSLDSQVSELNPIIKVQTFDRNANGTTSNFKSRIEDVSPSGDSGVRTTQLVKRRSRRVNSVSSGNSSSSKFSSKTFNDMTSVLSRKKSLFDVYSERDRILSGQIDLSKPLKLVDGATVVNVGDRIEERVVFDPSVDDVLSIVTRTVKNGVQPTSAVKEEEKDGSQNNLGSGVNGDEDNDMDIEAGSHIDNTTKNGGTGSSTGIERWLEKHKMNWVWYMLVNFQRPASVGTLLGIIVAMVPWLKALFVHTDVHMHQAPDGLPVLNFIMDFTAYISDASVPLGILMLGATMGRLKINKLPPGFWRSAVMMTVIRLFVSPIIGILVSNKFYELKWIDSEIAKFLFILTFAMPTATAQVYFTAFFSPIDGDHIQMDCLSVCFLSEYCILMLSLAILLTYTIKVDLKL